MHWSVAVGFVFPVSNGGRFKKFGQDRNFHATESHSGFLMTDCAQLNNGHFHATESYSGFLMTDCAQTMATFTGVKHLKPNLPIRLKKAQGMFGIHK